MKVGELVKGKVVKLMRYGAVIKLEGGEEGFVHISKISNDYVRRVQDYLKEGQEVTAKIVGRTRDGKWELSMKGQKNAIKDTKKNEFERKLARFLKESDRKLSEYRKRVEKKGGRGRW
ncbi:MAG: RNA-binding protein [Thermotoga sp. 4484_232]|nr:S1 RNA-binding domain-containing protein [Thermotogaceae bacterium]OQX58075.1 MAG: RNA-binding protein [Thermotoga sp. 4484_232]RKX41550.1 MAG: RNA-binding protein [Thermotogota bacterium]RKX56666.1 MAG: RNA-binding protein [Thermotoga sp.]HDG62151.1 S1 RNA-binding domain-containing protein [Thermotoga sp.]